MRVAIAAIFLFVSTGVAAAQKVTFSEAPKAEIVERVEHVPAGNRERGAQIEAWFRQEGCTGESLREQPVSGADGPNIICELRGKTAQSIIVGAHYERSTSANRPFDDWSGAALLPDLYHCLSDKERRHTIIFVAFADRRDSVAGAETFAAHMTVPELAHTEAMVNLDVLGLSPTKVWPGHSDKELVHLLMVMVYAMKIPASQVDIGLAGRSDSEPFAARQVPQITVHSLTRQNLLSRRAGAFNPQHYYGSYRLLCGYLGYLDKKLKKKSHAE